MDMQIGKRAPITQSALPDRLFGFSKRNCTRRMNNSENTESRRGDQIDIEKGIRTHTQTRTYDTRALLTNRRADAAAVAGLSRFRISLAICK